MLPHRPVVAVLCRSEGRVYAPARSLSLPFGATHVHMRRPLPRRSESLRRACGRGRPHHGDSGRLPLPGRSVALLRPLRPTAHAVRRGSPQRQQPGGVGTPPLLTATANRACRQEGRVYAPARLLPWTSSLPFGGAGLRTRPAVAVLCRFPPLPPGDAKHLTGGGEGPSLLGKGRGAVAVAVSVRRGGSTYPPGCCRCRRRCRSEGRVYVPARRCLDPPPTRARSAAPCRCAATG